MYFPKILWVLAILIVPLAAMNFVGDDDLVWVSGRLTSSYDNGAAGNQAQIDMKLDGNSRTFRVVGFYVPLFDFLAFKLEASQGEIVDFYVSEEEFKDLDDDFVIVKGVAKSGHLFMDPNRSRAREIENGWSSLAWLSGIFGAFLVFGWLIGLLRKLAPKEQAYWETRLETHPHSRSARFYRWYKKNFTR